MLYLCVHSESSLSIFASSICIRLIIQTEEMKKICHPAIRPNRAIELRVRKAEFCPWMDSL